ncbi:MAG TPA: hypothetical protein VGN42_18450 [Pirellulales bacterium]|jgi:hypothetical protein|nr:hypothetical protein [Pirellulales bacterium]
MADSFASLIDRIRSRDGAICGNAPAWILEAVLECLQDAELKVRKGRNAREVAEDFYAGACRFVTDQCSDEADALLDAISRLRE